MPLKRRYLTPCLIALVVLMSSCGHSSNKTSSAKLDASYSPQKSLSDAVTSILQNEQKNDAAASFALLDPSGRSTYKDVADWSSRLTQLPAVTGFHLESAKGTKQTVIVNHLPGLDPFKGLSAAQETQIWVGHQYAKGWLVEPDPQTDPILPDSAKATEAAKEWTQAVQACDKNKAHDLQAIDTLIASATPTLCGVVGNVTVSAPSELAAGPDSKNVVDQYSTDALHWAKTLTVSGPANFHIIVAPIGDNWKVLALY